MAQNCFPKAAINQVNRYRNRGKYDFETIHDIVDKTPILHVSFTPVANGGQNGGSEPEDQYPVILPMLGFTGNFEDPTAGPHEPRSLYLHGYVSSRFLRTAAKAGENSDCDGTPVCVAATLFDGVVLALTPNHHSCNYRSAVVFGRAHAVTDPAERLWAMEAITDNLVPGRWAATRYPNDVEIKSTGIVRVDITSASAKIRTGSTGEDRKDLADIAMRKRVWAGVVPSYLVYGEPIPAKTNMTEGVPDYLDRWRTRETNNASEYALAVAE